MNIAYKIFILFTMIFCHIVDDYYLQGWLASAKQKSWWEKNAPEKLYKYDYLAMSKITDYLLKDDVIVVMDVDGVLAPYEFSELSHSMTDDEWDRLVASGESPYKDVRPIKLMQKFIQKKGIDKVYTCSKSPSSEIPGKRAFIKNNYNLPDDNIYFTLEKTEKLTVLQTLQQKLGLKPSQIAIVEDTVKTLDYIRAHSDFVTVHVSSFME